MLVWMGVVGAAMAFEQARLTEPDKIMSEADMIACACDENGDDLFDVSLERDFVVYEESVRQLWDPLGLSIERQEQIQILDGAVILELIPHFGPNVPFGEIHASEEIEGSLYTEHVVYYDGSGSSQAFSGPGYRMEHTGTSPLWEDAQDDILAAHPGAHYSEQELNYVDAPLLGDVDVVPFAVNSNAIKTFYLIQEVQIPNGKLVRKEVGWLLRERKFFGAATGFKYVDHWLFTDEFDGLDASGEWVEIFPEGGEVTVGEWYTEKLAPAVGATRYAYVDSHAFEPLQEMIEGL